VDNCIFCGLPIKHTVSQDLVVNFSCSNCGKYRIEHQALKLIPNELRDNYFYKKHMMSGYIREMTDIGAHLDVINVNNFTNLINNDTIPKDIIEKSDKLLLHILRKSKHMFDEIKVSSNQPAIAYSRTEVEFTSNFEALKQFGFINYSKVTVFTEDDEEEIAMRCSLTIEGIKRAQLIEKSVSAIKQCYVAMWCSDGRRHLYDSFISTAIIESGYSPVIIPEKESNDDTFDEMILEIRKSKFVIIDLSENRPSIYYEGGFAYGLGKEIIYICKEDDLDDKSFHISHSSILFWKDGNDLYTKLKNRILATIV
jgi:hypothetical protein